MAQDVGSHAATWIAIALVVLGVLALVALRRMRR
jgi:hypothetical protein